MTALEEIGGRVRSAAAILAGAGSGLKNEALQKIAEGLVTDAETILEENAKDIAEARKTGISESMIRLSIGIEDLDDLLHDFKVALG